MNYYFYNTDAKSLKEEPRPRYSVLINNGFAATGGNWDKYGKILGDLNPGDRLLMYEKGEGVVAIGRVREYWDGVSHETPQYYMASELGGDRTAEYEYRIPVDWFLDLTESPIGIEQLRKRFGYERPWAPSRAVVPIGSSNTQVASALIEELQASLRARSGEFDTMMGSDAPYGHDRERDSSQDRPPRVEAGAGFGEPEQNRLIEAAAVGAVRKAYEADGWSVWSVERDKCGFDLECTQNGALEQVEVKGIRGTGLCFFITAGEVEQARTNANFVLVVVTSALSASPKLAKFAGTEFCRRFDLSAIQYRAVLAR